MRTTITIDDDVHGFVTNYARAKGISLSAALGELLRKAERAEEPVPDIRRSPNGFPLFPPASGEAALTEKMVKQLEGEEFDPKAFA
jgi:hypothetical protein